MNLESPGRAADSTGKIRHTTLDSGEGRWWLPLHAHY